MTRGPPITSRFRWASRAALSGLARGRRAGAAIRHAPHTVITVYLAVAGSWGGVISYPGTEGWGVRAHRLRAVRVPAKEQDMSAERAVAW